MRYMKQIVTEKSPRATIFRWIAIFVMIAITTLCLSLPAFAQTKYVITDGDSVIVCMSSSDDPKVVIQEAGLQLGESDTYTTQTSNGISEIHINRIHMVTVREGNETIVVGCYGGTVSDVLASLDITLSDSDILSCERNSITYDGMTIEITRLRQELLEYDEIIPHTVHIYEDDSLEPGEEQVLVEGCDGLTKVRAEIIYENGVETQRSILSELVITNPTDGIILRGVDRSVKEQENSGLEEYRQSDTSDKTDAFQHTYADKSYVPGTNLAYRELLDYDATAYYCPTSWNITFTGTEARVGTVAVDPRYIPLGTKMYIVSADGEYVYGYCIAEDTGGVIKGKIVDLYFDTYDECVQFGRRDVKIYILE